MFLWSFLFFVVFFEGGKATPKVENIYFEKCSLSSPKLEKCIQNSIMQAKPLFVKGIPEIGFPTLEPLAFKPFEYHESNQNIKMTASFTDLYMEGLSNMTVEDVKVRGDLNTEMKIDVTITSPLFRGLATWSGKGRFFQFKLNGGGKSNVNLTQSHITFSMKGKAKTNENDGKKYFSLHSFSWDIILGKAEIYVDGLFPNDEHLTKTTNKFINQNMKYLFPAVKGAILKNTVAEFKKPAKIVFDTWPIDELLLDD